MNKIEKKQAELQKDGYRLHGKFDKKAVKKEFKKLVNPKGVYAIHIANNQVLLYVK
jgi:hypothetical protein